ncbi:endogenous retrovirus group K member 113 Env polyprotein-like [Peromyscus eremicus]|uniref:endogenous retrovirus group K member 113 Env polyprotein-like n=1 Tax=Peromyscus eremicus TaxID=42410 RepID=UPI0027DBA64F|nr:endogenous retrovirus group K member 113 Env polyprotein-like [Peromyscus eremicus]XP_059126129.1 endogenous retrovirus group K member 113 Env polyprotein-like [Peromyscus eremicus]XP_059126130.1 endogenous retrovirus group K member 113 Env polyprotein-like [Peromyscus eremicus]XP_059126131.1 endogenous retrovirus group K member 113 Env polyprotein-like [Peromyscus eremicus]XP_059126133.1 endogenous retrovirus group K member 113 Env polyprotein-like [Peromyscus eremicus]
MGTVAGHSSRLKPVCPLKGTVLACVKMLYILLVREANICMNGSVFKVSCLKCILTSCIPKMDNHVHIIVLKQPSFVILPVYMNDPWFDDKGLQVIEEIKKALSRQKRVAGLVIAGIAALVTMLVTTMVASVTLSHFIQTAGFVNQLSMNVSMTLEIQEDIDVKLEHKLNVLYNMVQFLGDELQSLKARVHLKCHANYEWICVTSSMYFMYNESAIGWERVKVHLKGIWHDSNESLDLAKLHQEILEMRKAKLDFDAAKTAEDILEQFKGAIPSWSSFTLLLSSVVAIGACVLVGIVCLPMILKLILNSLWRLGSELHRVKLRTFL